MQLRFPGERECFSNRFQKGKLFFFLTPVFAFFIKFLKEKIEKITLTWLGSVDELLEHQINFNDVITDLIFLIRTVYLTILNNDEEVGGQENEICGNDARLSVS